MLVVLLPAIAIGAAAAWEAVRSYRTAFETRMLDTTRALALAVDSEFETYLAALSAFSSSPNLLQDDLAGFRAWAGPVAATWDSWVVVNEAGPGFPQVVNTLLPEGVPLPGAAAPGEGASEVLARVVQTGRPAISDLFTGKASGRPLVAIAAPVLRDGQVRYVVVMPMDPGRLSRVLQAQGLGGGAVAAIGDARNQIVARSRDHDRLAGATAPGPGLRRAPGDEGLFRGRTADGLPALFAYRRLRTTPGWGVTLAEPLAAYEASWRRPLLALAGGALLLLAAATVAAVTLARRLQRPLAALVLRSRQVVDTGLSAHTELADARSGVAEFEVLRRSLDGAAAALREGEAEFRAAFEQAPIAMSQSDPVTGRLLRVNAAYTTLVGRSAGTLLRGGFAEVTHPDDRDAERATWERMLRGELPSYELDKRYLRPDGSVRWARVSATVIRGPDGQVLRTMAAAQDTTERKLAEAALRDSEERLRTVLAATPEWVKVVAPDGTLLQTNPAGLRVVGAEDEAELAGRPVAELVAPEFRARWWANHRRVCAGEGLVWEFDILRLRDGGRRRIETHAVPLRLPGGGPPAHLGVTRDVTERRAAEDRQTLLMREVDHRAKNILTVVQAAVRLTPKEGLADYAKAVEGRVRALARAHTLLADARWDGVALRDLVWGELAAFLPSGAGAGSDYGEAAVEVSGPAVTLAPTAAQPIAMAVHELATNAAKYGALSARRGKVSVTWCLDHVAGVLRLHWVETGGPAAVVPTRRGFGTRVLEGTIQDQLGGRIERRWEPSGLMCEIAVPFGRMLAKMS